MNRQKLPILVILALTVGLTCSCVSLQDRTMTQGEREQAQIIGSVTVEFTSTHFLHLQSGLREKAYAELKKAAQQKYSGNIDIQNIVIAGSFSGWNILWGMLWFASPVLLDVQKITATGDVVLYSGSASTGITQQLTEAITRASLEMAEKIPRNSTIAVLSVFSTNRDTSEYIIGELEYNLVNSGRFIIVDRRRLDQIRNEQNFQLSGDVSDDSAISIGNMLGANIVITGEITGTGSNQRLILKALDVRTAQIITMVREQF
jgi:hypothetical protein